MAITYDTRDETIVGGEDGRLCAGLPSRRSRQRHRDGGPDKGGAEHGPLQDVWREPNRLRKRAEFWSILGFLRVRLCSTNC